MEIFTKYLEEKVYSELNKQVDEVFIKGLSNKGFDFINESELSNFVKSNVRCEDNIHFKEKIYFVKDIPFLLHKYNVFVNNNFKNGSIVMNANYGEYAYL